MSEGFLILFVAVSIFAFCFGFGILTYHAFAPDYRAQAIERGFALYCPQDGRFAWIGECDE